MKTTITLAPSNEVLRVPYALADRLVIEGLSAAQTRLAVVLVALAAVDGKWSIAKPILESMTGITMDNAFAIMQLLEEAMLAQPKTNARAERRVRLFDDIDYAHGTRHKLAGMVSFKLTSEARVLLSSEGRVVRIPADELRLYGSLGGIMLRLRIAARLSEFKDGKSAKWRLDANDLPHVFGAIADRWAVERKNTQGETKSYVSLARAGQLFFVPGVEEVNEHCLEFNVKLQAFTLGDGPRSRWKALILEARRMKPVRIKGVPVEPAATPELTGLARLDRRKARKAKLPAYARKAKTVSNSSVGS